MPKPQYIQKFRSLWLSDPLLKDWLTSVESTAGTQAKCKLCNHNLTNRYADLKAHASAKKHKTNANIILGPQRKIEFTSTKVTDLARTSEAEAKLALFVAQHTSINLTDQLVTVCKHSFTDSKSSLQIQMHRTKCSNIIKNVLAQHFNTDLKLELKDASYGLLIDASTDIAVHKYLGIVIIYFSKKHEKIIPSW